MARYEINGGRPLEGTVTISGAKNAAVAIIPAALLVDGVCRIENIPQISDVTALLGTYDARNAAIVQKMHKRVDRVEAVCAAALVERGQKGTGNAGERAVRKRERQRGVKDEPAFFAAHARDAAAAIRELGGEKSVAKRFEKLFAKALGIVDRAGEKRVGRAAGADGV